MMSSGIKLRPFEIELGKKFVASKERAKCVEFHPDQPWVLFTLHDGSANIWNYETQKLIRTFDVTCVPLRQAKFIVRRNWIITGGDDHIIRVYHFRSNVSWKQWEAHNDYLRCLVVHPTLPCVLSSSDDMTIKLWNWEQDWSLVRMFESHQHYVMSLDLHPTDNTIFASASLDKTIKVWSINSDKELFTLEGHSGGLNYVRFQPGEDILLISGADDKQIKIWNYNTQSCIQTLAGHNDNVNFAFFHPKYPIIISGGEDDTIRFWDSNTDHLVNTFRCNLYKLWRFDIHNTTHMIAVAADEGVVIFELRKQKKD